jgi:WD40 repeat protein
MQLASLVAVYRGVFLYGDSGNGKSSLVNAGLLPEAIALGYEPVRVRVQPRAGEELVIERIAICEDGGDALPSALIAQDDGSARDVLAIEEFEARVRDASPQHRPLVVFDQFEEILTLFDEATDSQRAIAEMIVRLLREALPVKLLFAFREDYLGRVKQLLDARPELVDQALRLGPPSADALQTIIRGPFERFPGAFDHELTPALAKRLSTALAERFGNGEVSLSEVETVCLRLWQAPDPEALLDRKGVQGLLEDELGEALDAFPPDLRVAAVALLSEMVTSAGTRNVVSAEDLRLRVREENDAILPATIDEALQRLERDSRLVRRERRRDLYLYEITSEFLVPWISKRREELHLAQESRRQRRRLRILGAIAAGLLVVLACVAVLAVELFQQKNAAKDATRAGVSRQLAAEATLQSQDDLVLGLSLSLAALEVDDTIDARRSLLTNLLFEPRIRRLLKNPGAGPFPLDFSSSGRRLVADNGKGVVASWDPTRGGAPTTSSARPWVSADVNADARLLAAVSEAAPRRATIYDVTSPHAVVKRRLDHGEAISDVLFGPRGRLLATVGESGPVVIWDVARGRRLRRQPPGGDWVRSAWAFSHDGRTLALASSRGGIVLWDVRRGRQRGFLADRGRFVDSAIAFDPSDRQLVAAIDTASGSGLELFDVAQRRVRWRTPVEQGVSVLTMSRSAIAGVLADGHAQIWNARYGQRDGPPITALGEVSYARLSADGRTLALAGDGGQVGVLNKSRGSALGVPLTAGYVESAVFQPDGRALVTSRFDAPGIDVLPLTGRRRTYARGFRVTILAAAPGAAVVAVATSPSGRRRTRARAALFDTRDGRTIALGDRTTNPSRAAFSPDGRLLAVGGLAGSVTLWSARDGSYVGSTSTRDRRRAGGTGVEFLGFDPGSKSLLWSGADKLYRWDLDGRHASRKLAQLPGSLLLDVAPSHRVAVVMRTSDGAMLLEGVDDGRELSGPVTKLRTGEGSVLAFSPDSALLAVAREKGTSVSETAIDVFDVSTGRLVGHLTTEHATQMLTFSAAHTLASASGSEVRIWRLDQRYLRRHACLIANRSLTPDEWQQYVGSVEPYHETCPA